MIVYVWSGLASRCVTLAEAYYLLKARGTRLRSKKLTVIWPIENACGIHFKEVFAEDMFDDIELKVIEVDNNYKKYYDYRKSDGVLRNLKKLHLLKAIHAAVLIFMDMLQEYKRDFVLGKLVVGKNYFDYTPPKEIGWAGENYEKHLQNTWQQVNEALSGKKNLYIKAYCGIIKDNKNTDIDFSVIKFQKEYWNKVESIIVPGERYIAIHIRRTDHQTAIAESSTNAFIQKINEVINQQSDVKLFLATDDKKEEENLKHIYGDKLVVQEDKEWGRTNSNEMKSGIIDCLCLSRCEYILGSYTSVFSFFAAKYGNKELIICRDANSV